VNQGQKVFPAPREPLGYEQVTALSASTGLTVPAGARLAVIHVQTQAVRWRDDGGAPTSTVGMPLAIDDIFLYVGDLAAIRFIEGTPTAVLNVSYYN